MSADQWSFRALPLSSNGRKCPIDCSSTQHGSCGRCIETNRIPWMWKLNVNGKKTTAWDANLYEVSNIFYYKGLPHFYGRRKDTIIPCGNLCNPMFHPYSHLKENADKFRWYAEVGQWPSYAPKNITCRPKDLLSDPALVVNWMAIRNHYHGTFDCVLPAFVTASHIAKAHGCAIDRVKVYIKDGFEPAVLEHMWSFFFGKAESVRQMSGCYKTVYYGQMMSVISSHNPFAYNYTAVPIDDYQYSSWLYAFRINLRAALAKTEYPPPPNAYLQTFHSTGCPGDPPWHLIVRWRSHQSAFVFADMYEYCSMSRSGAATEEQKRVCCGQLKCAPKTCVRQTSWQQTKEMLLVHHQRAPDWFNKLDWKIPAAVIVPVKFEDLPYYEQVSMVASSKGLLGIAGSGMAQHMYLQSGSLLLFVGVFQTSGAGGPADCCVTVMDKNLPEDSPVKYQPEDAANCYHTTAAHSGIHVVYWRWCRPNVHHNAAGFTSVQAQAVLKLLFSFSAKRTPAQRAKSNDLLDAKPGYRSHASSARLCMVLDPNYSSDGWPRCDMNATVPVYDSTESCVSGRIGFSYKKRLDESIESVSAACRACEFGSCAGAPPQLAIFSGVAQPAHGSWLWYSGQMAAAICVLVFIIIRVRGHRDIRDGCRRCFSLRSCWACFIFVAAISAVLSTLLAGWLISMDVGFLDLELHRS